MNPKFKLFTVIAILVIFTLACNAPIGKSTQSPNPTPEALSFTPSPESINNSSGIDFGKAALSITDLPEGFEQLSEEDLANLGITKEELATAFEGKLSKATPQAFSAFINYTSFEVVVSMILAPLTTLEKVSFDLYLSNSNKAAKDFSSGAGANTSVISDFGKIGNSSVAVTFTTGAKPNILRGDVAISRRGSAGVISMVFYPDGSTPPVDLLTIAQIMDGKVEELQ